MGCRSRHVDVIRVQTYASVPWATSAPASILFSQMPASLVHKSDIIDMLG